MSPHPRFDELKEWTNHDLIAFLRSDLDLGFTFARTAELEASMQNRQHFEQARQHAEAVIEMVHRFEARVTDTEALREIQQRTSELQKLVSSLAIDSPSQQR